MNLDFAQQYILERLSQELAPHLTYHHINHTLSVTERALQIAQSEGVTNKESVLLLRTAALYHDSGFLISYDNHEYFSCQIVEEILPQFEYNTAQILQITEMIKATKIPQSPHDLLAKILCDADLDYLGGTGYYPTVASLFEELKYYGKMTSADNWIQVQIDFLTKHRYFTQTNQKERSLEKEKRVNELRLSIRSFDDRP